ncbi:MAG: class I SAM-dependent methyltransferase [Saprospiraceae bacterium]|nr:class I SAM-dependent methyltransferase [Saprospiraceae bacterium]
MGLFKFYILLFITACISCRQTAPQGGDTNRMDVIDMESNGEFDHMVNTYEDENRHIWQKPDRVIELLGDISDKIVVDIGAGSGYFAFRLIPVAKKVVAVDIDPRFIRFMNEKKKLLPPAQREKFEARLASPEDPMLATNEAQAVLMVNTYVYIEDRVDYFRKLKMALAPEAKVVIIEFKMKDIPQGPPREEKIALAEVERELKEAGYVISKIDDQTLEYQYIITAMVD